MVSKIVFEGLCRLDDLINRKPPLPEDERDELIFRRDLLAAENPETAKFRKLTINDLMRKKR